MIHTIRLNSIVLNRRFLIRKLKIPNDIALQTVFDRMNSATHAVHNRSNGDVLDIHLAADATDTDDATATDAATEFLNVRYTHAGSGKIYRLCLSESEVRARWPLFDFDMAFFYQLVREPPKNFGSPPDCKDDAITVGWTPKVGTRVYDIALPLAYYIPPGMSSDESAQKDLNRNLQHRVATLEDEVRSMKIRLDRNERDSIAQTEMLRTFVGAHSNIKQLHCGLALGIRFDIKQILMNTRNHLHTVEIFDSMISLFKEMGCDVNEWGHEVLVELIRHTASRYPGISLQPEQRKCFNYMTGVLVDAGAYVRKEYITDNTKREPIDHYMPAAMSLMRLLYHLNAWNCGQCPQWAQDWQHDFKHVPVRSREELTPPKYSPA
jgi:hypothetical protein